MEQASRHRFNRVVVVGGALVCTVTLAPTVEAQALPARPVAAESQQVVAPFSVTVTGTRAIGHRLTASVSPQPAAGSAVRYVWARNGVPLAGASAARTVLLTDAGAPLSVSVTITRNGVSRTASASAGTVARPTIKRASAKSIKKAHLPSGTHVWYTTGTTSRWIETAIPGHAPRMFDLKGSRLAAYLHTGGIAAHGVPVSEKCGLPGHGCLTHYTHGTIYVAPHGVRGTTPVTGARGDMIAVLASQVGYHDRYGYYALHDTKYNEFVNSPHAWCSFVQSWAAYYSGHPKVAPPYKTFDRFRNHLTSTGTKLSKPKVGAFVLLSVTETFSHCAMIVSVSPDKRSFQIIEGNWGNSVHSRWLTVGGYNSPQQFWYPTGY